LLDSANKSSLRYPGILHGQAVMSAAQPARLSHEILRLSGLPNAQSYFVSSVLFWVTHTLQDLKLSLREQVVESLHSGMQRQSVAEFVQLVLGQSKRRALTAIGGILERDHRVESVIPSG